MPILEGTSFNAVDHANGYARRPKPWPLFEAYVLDLHLSDRKVILPWVVPFNVALLVSLFQKKRETNSGRLSQGADTSCTSSHINNSNSNIKITSLMQPHEGPGSRMANIA